MKERKTTEKPAKPGQGGQSEKSESGFIAEEIGNKGTPHTPTERDREKGKRPKNK